MAVGATAGQAVDFNNPIKRKAAMSRFSFYEYF